MSTEWILNQVFAFIGLIFVVISYQQNDSKKLIIFRNIATLFVFIGLIIYGNVSAIIFCGVGAIRNLVALYFAYKPNTNKIYKYIAAVVLSLILVVLNIIYWKNYLNIFSIVIGILAIITFMQNKASTIRKLSVSLEILSISYYGLLLSPTNVAIEVIGLISAIIGILRLDREK